MAEAKEETFDKLGGRDGVKSDLLAVSLEWADMIHGDSFPLFCAFAESQVFWIHPVLATAPQKECPVSSAA
jgi:hypothetical protein